MRWHGTLLPLAGPDTRKALQDCHLEGPFEEHDAIL